MKYPNSQRDRSHHLYAPGGVFGTAGAIPEHKIEPRWEPSQYATLALTYGHEFGGPFGAGFEFSYVVYSAICMSWWVAGARKGIQKVMKIALTAN
jgi:hypothetical protein